MFKSGFVALVGRPNVGKSSLLNALVKQKIAICSNKPQTTRNAIRGIVTTEEQQIIFVDTPGMHKPKSLLGERMNSTIHRTLAEVDAIVMMLDATDTFGGGDKFVIERVQQVDTPTVCVINKADKVLPPRLLEQITNAAVLGKWVDVLTTSATRQTGLGDLISTLATL
ncbi:MAG: GTPase Era, partial [Actinomycetota bacterium]